MKKIFPYVIISIAFFLSLPEIIQAQATTKISSQKNKSFLNQIGISIPVIWNNSEATYYLLGSPKYPAGKASSYGLNIDYSRSLYKGFYGKLGIGYFKQSFGIIRPFTYDSPIQIGWFTPSYYYNNIQLFGGIGYKGNISRWLLLNGDVTYNQYYSYRQKYIHPSPLYSPQVNHKSISLGRMANLETGVEIRMSSRISVETVVVLPFYTHWNNDEIFGSRGYSADEPQIARNKSSIGLNVSCNYNF